MKHRARLIVAACAAALVLGSSPGLAADRFAVTSLNANADGTVSIEFTIPQSIIGDRNVEDALTITANDTAVENPTFESVASSSLETVLLIDASSSMGDNGALDAAKAATIAFVRSLPLDVAVGVVSFSDSPSLVAPLGFDRNNVTAAIGQISAGGARSLHDAVVFSRLLFSGGTRDRQVIVLTDGSDTASASSLESALEVSAELRTSVIVLEGGDSSDDSLDQLAEAGNGRLDVVAEPSEIEASYTRIASELADRIRVTFRSTASGTIVYQLLATDEDGTEYTASVTRESALPSEPQPGPDPTTPVVTTPRPSLEEFVTTFDGGASSDTLWALGFGTLFGSFVILLTMVSTPVRRRTQELRARQTPIGRSSDASFVKRLTTGIDELLARSGRERVLAAKLDVAGIPLRAGEFVVLAGVGAVVLLLLLSTLMSAGPAILLSIFLVPLLIRSFLERRISDRRAKFVEQLPDVLQIMVSSLRAGYGLPQTLDVAANQSEEPARSELQRVMFEVRIGRDPGEALLAAAERMDSPDFSWVVSAMQINREVGGELAVVLENVAETVRERQRLARQVQVLTAEGRLSANVLTGLPILLGGFLFLTNPEYFEPLAKPPGPIFIIVGLVLLITGRIWINRLIKVGS
ncbi:MAG: type II secretion system F family protein [Ilumatobacteraceae bacterium]